MFKRPLQQKVPFLQAFIPDLCKLQKQINYVYYLSISMRLVSAMPRTEMLGDRCQVVRGRVQQCGARLPSLGFISSLVPGPGLAWRGGAVLSVRADINLISSSRSVSSDANMPCTARNSRWRPRHNHHQPIMEIKRGFQLWDNLYFLKSLIAT